MVGVRAPVGPGGAGDGDEVDAGMLIEASIFGGKDSLLARLRHGVQGDGLVTAAGRVDDFVEEEAVAVEDAGDRRRLAGVEVVEVGQWAEEAGKGEGKD